jgi:hypothetical protein
VCFCLLFVYSRSYATAAILACAAPFDYFAIVW